MNPWMWLLWSAVASVLLSLVVAVITVAVKDVRGAGGSADGSVEKFAAALVEGRVFVEPTYLPHVERPWMFRVVVEPEKADWEAKEV